MKQFIKKYFNVLKNKRNIQNQNLLLPGTRIAGDINLISVKRGVSFGGDVLLYANAPISIGECTLIAHHVIIHTSTHDYTKHPISSMRIDRPIKIGNHVWIGTGSLILPGVIIEDYAVIGAGTVVTKNVPKGAVVAGNPARILKFRQLNEILDKSDFDKETLVLKKGYKEEYYSC